MTAQQRYAVLLSALWSLILPILCLADGFIVVHNPPEPIPGHFAFAPLQVSYHHVTVEIDDQVAATTVDQEFYNPNNRQMEGTYLFPLPEGAHIDKFSMDINGKPTDAELLPADKARSVYEDIVRNYKDPALLEYSGRDAFKVRIFPIEPNAPKRIKIQYTQLLKSDGDLLEYAYPLNTEKFSSSLLKDLSVRISLHCSQPLKSVYCPSHNAEIKRDGADRAVVGYEDKNVRPDTDFKLVFSRAKAPIGVDLLSYRSSSDDGYFLLLASPGLQSASDQVQEKDVAFVLDTSGSMAGPKLEQAKKALRFCLANLNASDRFELIRFSTDTDALFGSLQPATSENRAKAESYIKDLKAIGGTALRDALVKTLQTGTVRSDADKRPYVIIFLTDGQPTVGETREDAIVESIEKVGGNTRIFSFGIGTDVNTHLLDRIASATRAVSQYVLPEEDIEVKVSSFYTKISQPVLSNLAVHFDGGIRTSQLYPNQLPDLFNGEMLTLFGRYTGQGPSSVTISGTVNGQNRQFTTDVRFTDSDIHNAFIPRLWATRRVGWLLDEIRLHGENAELRQEIVRLAREHGIVTPYTAYLIMEDERNRNVPVALRSFHELERDAAAAPSAKAAYSSADAEATSEKDRSGSQAVQNARRVADLKAGWNEQQAAQVDGLAKAPSAPGVSQGYRQAQNYAQQARVINGRAFYQNGTIWTDATAQARKDLKQQTIHFNSDEYFALLKAHPAAAPWLALGNEVDVVLDETFYQIR